MLQKACNLVETITPLRFFVVMAIAFGLFFMLVTPPLQTPDETVHFLRAYQISEANPVIDRVDGKVGGKLPKALGDTIDETTTNPAISFYPNAKYDGGKTLNSLSIKTNNGQKEVYDFSATALYSPVAYAPQAIGIGVGRLLQLSPIVMMYLGRLSNLATWIVLLGLAIKFIPRKKWVIVAIGLLPMALSQAASLSSDVVAVGLVAVFTCYILHLIQTKKTLVAKQLAILFGLCAGVALSKQVMFVFLPLVLLIPIKQFKNTRIAWLFRVGAIVLPCVLLAGWMMLNRGIDISAGFYNKQVPVEQIKFVATNPHSYINVLWNTYFYTWGDGITRSFIGTFGWADTPLSELITVIGYVGLAFLYFVNTEKVKQWLTRYQKLLIVLVAVVYLVAVSTALYVYYTPVGFKIIYGLQGRYFTPLAILLIPVLYGNWLVAKKNLYRKVAIYLPTFLLVASCITLYVRFYVNNV